MYRQSIDQLAHVQEEKNGMEPSRSAVLASRKNGDYQRGDWTGMRGVIHDESDVEDVLHDVLLQVWEQSGRYNPNEKGLRGLLVTLARRRALDGLRRRAAYRRATESLKFDTGNPLTFEIAPNTNQVEVNDLSKLLNRAIQVLPEAQKEVINLAFFKGMSQREIASKRQISLGTVKTRLHLAQRKLHNYLVPMQSKI